MRLATALIALALLAAAPVASAETFHVTIWQGSSNCTVDPACVFSADSAQPPPPGGTATAEFDYTTNDGINWSAQGNFNTFGDFFAHDLDGSISGFTGMVDESTFMNMTMSTGAGADGNTLSSYFAITGVYQSGAAFQSAILHDDGASLYVDGTNVFSAPGRGQQAINGPYNFDAGKHTVGLFFIAADGGPSVLGFSLPGAQALSLQAALPEPGIVALLGIGLLVLGFSRRRSWRGASSRS